MRHALNIINAFVIATSVLWLLLVPVWSHENYPAWCCNGDGTHGDCKTIACDGIAETEDGYDWEGHHFRPNQTMPSFDQQCHACVSNNMPTCLFILPAS